MLNQLRFALALGCSLLGLVACRQTVHDGATAPDHAQNRSEAASNAAELEPYPLATWRLAREQLDRVMLRLSHVAIRHRDSKEGESPLRTPDWSPDAKITRTRDEAIRMAQKISESLRDRPGDFAELAARSSDDAVTAPWGGSLGVISASRLPDEFLDAIAALRPGEISRPFETAYGIHVLRLEATGPEQWLSAARIVVAYEAGSPVILRPGHVRERTRVEALQLAQQIAEEARTPGASFEQLVDRYTDSPDAAQAGDVGVWSTFEAMTRNLVLEALSRVPLGAVTDPIDSPEGIQILKRSEAVPRERFAASYLMASVLLEGGSASAFAKMTKISKVLQAHPEELEKYQQTMFCAQPWAWSRGRGLGSEVEATLGRLAVGELAPAPVATATGVYIVRRIPMPPEEPAKAWLVRLPVPSEPDFDEVLRHVSAPGLAYNLKLLHQSLATLALPLDKRERVEAALSATSERLLQAKSEDRPALFATLWDATADTLSPREQHQLRAHVMAFTKYQLMQN